MPVVISAARRRGVMRACFGVIPIAVWICAVSLQVSGGGREGADGVSISADAVRSSLRFEENRGQVDRRVRYLARSSALNVFLTEDEAVIVFADESAVVRLRLEGAAKTAPLARMRLQGTSNYVIGTDPNSWLTEIPGYAQVVYQGAYEGIDWVFRGNGSQLECDFVVAAGSDASNIRMRIAGADSVEVTDSQELGVNVAGRRFYLNKLRAFQTLNGEQSDVPVRYEVQGTDVVGFQLGNYDVSRPVTIDPVLAYATYIGGASEDRAVAVAIDHHGSAYLTGRTASLNFPMEDPEQPANAGNFDAFITKLNADGSSLEYSTYFGGSGSDQGFGIAVDEKGNVYVSGQTSSPNLPIFNALQPTYGGGASDAFIMKLDPTGTQLLFSTFLGGSGDDRAFDCRLDASGAIYIVGATGSTNFPTVAALQPTFGGGLRDVFLAKMDSYGSTLLFSTYLGGSGNEANICALAVDNAGRAAVVGKTASTDFPVANAVQPTFGGGVGDAFVSLFNETGSAFIYSTYLGGSGDDQAFSAAVTRSGEVIAGGNSSSMNYPLVNPLQSTMNGVRDLAITKLDRDGQIIFSTLLGGSQNEQTVGLAVDAPGNVYFSGLTLSPNFPLEDPLQSTLRGPQDAIFGKISARGDSLLFSTYFGGSGSDVAGFLAVDPSGHNEYISGWTSSADFPVTPGAFSTSYAGGAFDGYIVKLRY
jgi:hypothetical protein